MFNWLSDLLMSATTGAAYDAAIYSAGLASTNGMHQPEEPEELRRMAHEVK